MITSKDILRMKYRKLRKNKSFEDSSHIMMANNIHKIISQYKKNDNLKIGGYISMDGEVDISIILRIYHNMYNYITLLPEISENKELVFRSWNGCINQLIQHKQYRFYYSYHGIPLVPNIVLTPLVCFDLARNRIGMGGGFYDRLISRYKNDNNQTLFIGVAYEIQYTNYIQPETHDHRVHCICTEKYIYI
ncbi:MAG: 5-formyltetrahydrofolate cyclo-ligase [Candidatus Xenolissoclinum pacificiensis L6]|uniref:5-formyltetrahydrofolate cyclo-ligase n=1 Tax=Candidatus Xenolissoclinum pacificiensis L6 TaxID=1401685 RepID=W2V0P5_9RICK|nr:MAG: 5-formyltetrahydrofolate cyclo-ligase [Candidatus Xenolissoclinum pacificiensis L6]